MKCPTQPYNLPDYLRGKTSAEEAAAIAGHLRQCAVCTEEAEELQTLFSSLDRRPGGAPDAAYWTSLLPRIHERIDRKPSMAGFAEILRLLLPVSVAMLLIIFLTRVDPLESTHESQEIHSIVHQLPAEELQDAAQSVANEESFGSGKGAQVNDEAASSDKVVLKELFEEGEKVENYSDLDQEPSDNILSDDDAVELVSRLEKN